MIIQFNTDNHITVPEKYRETLLTTIAGALHRFSDNITRVEVHVADENGNKSAPNDKRCTIEARVEGHKPVATTAHGDNIEQALNASIDKMTAALSHMFDRIRTH